LRLRFLYTQRAEIACIKLLIILVILSSFFVAFNIYCKADGGWVRTFRKWTESALDFKGLPHGILSQLLCWTTCFFLGGTAKIPVHTGAATHRRTKRDCGDGELSGRTASQLYRYTKLRSHIVALNRPLWYQPGRSKPLWYILLVTFKKRLQLTMVYRPRIGFINQNQLRRIKPLCYQSERFTTVKCKRGFKPLWYSDRF
jgi:hypothetical protein